jgi:hypothetical protein
MGKKARGWFKVGLLLTVLVAALVAGSRPLARQKE